MEARAGTRDDRTGAPLLEREFNVRMTVGADRLELRHLRWSGATWVLSIFFLLCAFMAYKSAQVEVPWQRFIAITFCGGLGAVFLFGLLTRAWDGVIISAGRLRYRYGLVRRSLPLGRITDVEARTDIHRYTSDGDQRVSVTLELMLVTNSRKFHIFDLHGGEADIPRMEELGERIRTAMLNHIR